MRAFIRSSGLLALTLAIAPLPAGTTAGAAAHDAVRALEGSFTVRYFGVRGHESFEILRHENGWTIDCSLEPPSDDLLPSETRYHLDENRRFLRADHTETGQGGVTVTYTIEDGRLIGRGTDDAGNSLPEASARVDEHGIVSGPNYATDFFVLYPLDLQVGETRKIEAAVFGYRSWRPEPLSLTTTRKKDRTIRGAGGRRVQCLVYRSRLVMDGSTTWATSYLDPQTGEVHRLTIDMTIGAAKVLRD